MKTLGYIAGAIEAGVNPDEASAELIFPLEPDRTVIDAPYLEPLVSGRLDRPRAALVIDHAARVCADARAIGIRCAVFAATRLIDSLGFQRLGYRTAADYARERLGIQPRTLRDWCRLGRRLAELPGLRAAYLEGRITQTAAEVAASVATPEDEDEWLALATGSSVRALKKAAREARSRRLDPEVQAESTDRRELPGPSSSASSDDRIGADTVPEPRSRFHALVPAHLLGKIDRVLELAAKVAGAALPYGTLWEFIAADFLSGVDVGPPATGPALPRVDSVPPSLPSLPLPAEGSAWLESTSPPPIPADTRSCPEDPHGWQRYLESTTSNWCFLPASRPRLQAKANWKHLIEEAEALASADEVALTARELDVRIVGALQQARTVNWQLGRLLPTIRNRRLWRDMQFVSFGHYVRERLGISPRHAQRLINADRAGFEYPALARPWRRGELSALQVELLIRALRCTTNREVRPRWVEAAHRRTFDELSAMVRSAERLSAARDPEWRRTRGCPSVALARAAGAQTGEESSETTVFVTSYAVWLTVGERETLERALTAAAEELAGPENTADPPAWRCLEHLLDAFVTAYDDEHAREMRRSYPVFERDGWRCRAPGCQARSALHAHHIVFRSHGGGDEPENLVVLCDHHHRSLHRGHIRVVGTSPAALYWELGTAPSGRRSKATRHLGATPDDSLDSAPVDRFFNGVRLFANEYFDGLGIRRLDRDARVS